MVDLENQILEFWMADHEFYRKIFGKIFHIDKMTVMLFDSKYIKIKTLCNFTKPTFKVSTMTIGSGA
jgi:hypothetical protein